jgi:hypothetical protein
MPEFRLFGRGSGGVQWCRGAEALIALLEEERGLIRAGRLAELGRLAARRDRLVARLAGAREAPQGPEAEALVARLRAAAARNLRLLDAAREGFAAAGRLIAGLRARDGAIGLYSEKGARLDPPGVAGHADRRA